jgi:hypothetical protein
MELFIYYVMQTLEPFIGKPFDLVVDLTHFSHRNEIQEQWITQFLQILPFGVDQNLHTIYIYNVCTAFKKFSKRLPRTITNKIAKKGIFMTSLNEIHAYISPEELRLPNSTKALDSSVVREYSPIAHLTHHRIPVMTSMKITHDNLQVMSVSRHASVQVQNISLN